MRLHIGYPKTGTTFLQTVVFPTVPNYLGRFYGKYEGTCPVASLKAKGPIDKGCSLIIKEFENKGDFFISWEGFGSLPHDQLFKLLDNKWQVLVTSRNFDDIFESRRRHPTDNFFLNEKIQKGIKDDEVRSFYNPENLRRGIDDLTIISYEKLFAADESEMLKLSKFLGHDISLVLKQNVHRKINAGKNFNGLCRYLRQQPSQQAGDLQGREVYRK